MLIILSLVISLLFLNDISANNPQKIIHLTSSDFDSIISNSKGKWLIIFYGENCPHCERAIIYLKEKIIKEFSSINYGLINCNLLENIWLNLRFNITRIPYIIQISKNLMFEYEHYFEKYSIVDFLLNGDKNQENALIIPKDFSYIEKAKLTLSRKWDNFITEKYMKIGLITGLISFIFSVIVCILIFFCCVFFLKKIILFLIKYFSSFKKKTKIKNQNDSGPDLSAEECPNDDVSMKELEMLIKKEAPLDEIQKKIGMMNKEKEE